MKLHFRPGNSFIARFLRRRRSRYVSRQSPIIIGGCPRSGTTLTRVILDAHPNIACGPESSLLAGRFLGEALPNRFEMSVTELDRLRVAAQDHAHFVELFLTHFANRQGKTRWAEKTPANVRHLAYVFRHFPNARFVHVVRDGRDVVCSLRTHPKHRVVAGHRTPTNIRRPLRSCIHDWLRATAAGMAWRRHPNYMELRYEDLVRHPESTLRRLCEFIGEMWRPELLEYHQQQGQRQNSLHFCVSPNAIQPLSSQAMGRWHHELTEQELRVFYRLAAHRLVELGYDIGDSRAGAAIAFDHTSQLVVTAPRTNGPGDCL